MEPSCIDGLHDFQLEAVQQATAIAERRRGVLIADSVGLGKTFVGLGLVERGIRSGARVLVVVPASLRVMWRRELKRLAVPDGDLLELLSHTQLALGRSAGRDFDLVVVDEAHAFRNPNTRRYRALRKVCQTANVVLITATPVNNSLADLYSLLRVFCADGAFRDLGIGSLKAALAGNDRDISRILRAVMIRRTRAEIRGRGGARFPGSVQMHAVAYPMAVPASELGRFLATLIFPGYRVGPDTRFPPDVLRFAFLKRMESSVHAMRVTLNRQIRFYEQFTSALERGMLLRPAVFRSMFTPADDALQLILEGVALETLSRVAPGLLGEARGELETLRAWRTALSTGPDAKLAGLLELLAARPPDSRTIVFTEYRDTARYLWSALRRRFPTALIDGGGAWIGESVASRRQVIERFAPCANGAPMPHPREAVRILVATDVLAEGTNLQDADAVVSYDLPWNPIRLVQRAGRIDRIGSDHEVVHVHNFIPDREFDAFLGLAWTIRTKLDTVRSTVGLERPVLEPGEDFEAVAVALREGQSGILDRLESGSESRLRSAWEAAAPPTALPGIPIAAMRGASGERMLVGLRRGVDWEVEFVSVTTGRISEGSRVEAILLEALSERNAQPGAWSDMQRAALAHLATVNRRSETTARRARSPAGLAARRLRVLMAELPLECTGPVVLARADAMLARLGSRGGFVDEEVEVILADGNAKLDVLLNRLEKVFSTAETAECEEAGWTLTGVIVAD